MTEIKPGTPLPWADDDDGMVTGPKDGRGWPVVCDLLQDHWKDDAIYIVTACNAYPDLLTGLREAREALAHLYEWSDRTANGLVWRFRDQEAAKAAKATLAHLDTLLSQEGGA